MKLNPRHFVFKDAEVDFSNLVIEFERKHAELTVTELLTILNAYQQRIIKYALQEEWKEADGEYSGPDSGRQADGD